MKIINALRKSFRTFWLEVFLRFRVLRETAGWLGGWRGEITPVGRLYAVKVSPDGNRENIGLVSTKAVTTAGVNFIVDAFQNSTEVETMKYHDSGTGIVAENITDTALGTPYGGSRATGTTAEGASANIYQTVGTNNYTSTLAITEHGVFSATTSGTLLDRSVFAEINVIDGDSIEFTYELTVPAGS